MTDGQQGNEVRLDAASRLAESPALRDAVNRAVAEGRVPGHAASVLAAADAPTRVAGGEALEHVVPPVALEAIVQRVGRPPLLITNGQIELEDLDDFPPGTDALIKGMEPLVGSVGRVEFVNASMAWGGTGWIVSQDGTSRVVATNRHVAQVVASRASDGTGVFLRSPQTGVRLGARIDFDEDLERQPGDPVPFSVTKVDYLADDLSADVALLCISGDGLPTALALSDDEAAAGDLVALIGYPAFDPRNDAADQARYFHDLYGVKRLSPGKVMQALGPGSSLTHDCTSLGGSSGSPLIRMQDKEVVGLHFSGVYGVQNSAVGVGTLRDLVAGRRPVVAAGAAVKAERPDGESVADGSHPADYFADRAGYDPAFLGNGLTAPWPGLPAAVEANLSRPSDEVAAQPFELRYTHFGVKYSRDRRQPRMTAVNIDGATTVRIKRANDKWFHDERIPVADQLSQQDYADPGIDRGHMVRREDPNWDPAATPGPDGPTSVVADLANSDTFHYVNAALQTSVLNQGKQLWQGLENYQLDSARTNGFKACVFTGPIFRDDDPEIAAGLKAPLEFWKVAVMVDAETNGLHATAYVLSQGDLIRQLLESRSKVEAVEGFTLGAYRTFQVAVKDLADATGYDFSAYVDADPLGKTERGQEALQTGEPVFVSLETMEDAVL